MTAITARKRTTYADYLKIDDNNRYEILTLERGEYLEFCKSKKEGIVKSGVLEGLEINSQEVFD